jgi:signal transduction histidine kinase
MKHVYLAFSFLLVSSFLFARSPDIDSSIDNRIPDKISVTETPRFYIDGENEGFDEVRTKDFTLTSPQFIQQLNNISNRLDYWMRFSVQNKTDSAVHTYFYPGYFDYTDMYFLSNGKLIKLIPGGMLTKINKQLSYYERTTMSYPLNLSAHQETDIFIKFEQKTPWFFFDKIQIFNDRIFNNSIVEDQDHYRNYRFFSILFIGFILWQMLYAMVQWSILRHKEYLYYFSYLLSLALYFLNKQETFMGVDLLFSHFPILTLYLNKPLMIIAYFFYFKFVRAFLSLDQNYPRLSKWFMRSEYFLLGYLCLDILLTLFNFNIGLQYRIFSFFMILIFIASAILIFWLFSKRKKLIYFIITGSLFVGLGNIVGMILSYLNYYEQSQFNNILIYSQIGILIEIFCFTSGLSYKSKLNEEEKIASQLKLIEQLKANQELQRRMEDIRNKISQDLHDDIGSTLSSISILSDMALRSKKERKALELLGEIKENSISLMDRMDDIVWSINPKNDSLENLLFRIKDFASRLFEAKEINYNVEIKQNTSDIRLVMEYRQHVYLIMKEAINNLVKYSNCTNAEIIVGVNEEASILNILIKDNGTGFNKNGQTPGNGLYSMQKRAEKINADFHVSSATNEGTAISLAVKIN